MTIMLSQLITRVCVLGTRRPLHGDVFSETISSDGGTAVLERVRLSQHFRPSLRLRGQLG